MVNSIMICTHMYLALRLSLQIGFDRNPIGNVYKTPSACRLHRFCIADNQQCVGYRRHIVKYAFLLLKCFFGFN